MSDSNGFMPAFANEDTQRQYEDWVWAQQQAQRQNAAKQSSNHRVLDKTTDALGSITGGALSGIADSGIDKGVSAIAAKITKPIDYLFSNPKIASVNEFSGKVGFLNSISFGLSVRDNVLHYNTWDALGRTIIDGVGFAAAMKIAAVTAPIWAPTAAGFVAGTTVALVSGFLISKATGFTKDALLGRKKYE